MAKIPIKLIEQIHQSHARAGIPALANPRQGHKLHFHTKEENYEGALISETKVLVSNAGYYIGHECFETHPDLGAEFGCWEPYDRISGYYSTREQAGIDLKLYKKALGC